MPVFCNGLQQRMENILSLRSMVEELDLPSSNKTSFLDTGLPNGGSKASLALRTAAENGFVTNESLTLSSS